MSKQNRLRNAIVVAVVFILSSCSQPSTPLTTDNNRVYIFEGQQKEWSRWANWYSAQQDKSIAILDDRLAGKITATEAVRRLSKLWADDTFPKTPQQ